MKSKLPELPNKEGWYFWTYYNCGEYHTKEIEIYTSPEGLGLYGWCDEVGIPGGPDIQDFTDGDEMCGHIPVQCLDGEFKFLREFDK